VGCIELVNCIEVAQSFQLSCVSPRPAELGGDNTSLEVVDLLFAAIGEYVIDVFCNSDPVIRAVPRESTFRRLPVARHVDLSLDRSRRGPCSIDGLWISDTKVGSADARVRTTNDDPGGARRVRSIRGRVGVWMRERETLREVDDVFQSLFDGMELPLFLRGVAIDGVRQ